MNYTLAICLIIVSSIGLALFAAFFFHSVWKGDGFFRRLTQNAILVLFALIFSMISVEVAFRLFFIQSDGINFTLASKRWFERYWQPINYLGYRDYELTSERIGARKRIAVVGDSFAAGGGIKDIEDRFSSQLAKRLGNDYVVMTIAKNGWNTQQEINGLLTYPYSPDLVIFSYYLNDIEGIAREMGYSRPKLLAYPPGWSKLLVDNSYALNFAYWRLFRWRAFVDPNQRTEIQAYQNYLRDLYEDPEVWAAHQEELRQVYNIAQSHQYQLIVVVFPDMLAIEETQDLSSKVVVFFQDLGIPVVDVTDLIVMGQPEKLIVNSVDSHPSIEVHTLVANALHLAILDLESRRSD